LCQSSQLALRLGGRRGRHIRHYDEWRRHPESGRGPGAESLQFRDVFAVSDKVAYLSSVGRTRC
jgi:hypothetical protein